MEKENMGKSLFDNNTYKKLSLTQEKIERNRKESIDYAIKKILKDAKLLGVLKRSKNKEFLLYKGKNIYGDDCGVESGEHWTIRLSKKGLERINLIKEGMCARDERVGGTHIEYISPITLKNNKSIVNFSQTYGKGSGWGDDADYGRSSWSKEEIRKLIKNYKKKGAALVCDCFPSDLNGSKLLKNLGDLVEKENSKIFQ